MADPQTYDLVKVKDLEPRDLLSDGTEILGRVEKHGRQIYVVTDRGVASWSEWAKVLALKWYQRRPRLLDLSSPRWRAPAK